MTTDAPTDAPTDPPTWPPTVTINVMLNDDGEVIVTGDGEAIVSDAIDPTAPPVMLKLGDLRRSVDAWAGRRQMSASAAIRWLVATALASDVTPGRAGHRPPSTGRGRPRVLGDDEGRLLVQLGWLRPAVDAWAGAHDLNRSAAVRSLIAHGLALNP